MSLFGRVSSRPAGSWDPTPYQQMLAITSPFSCCGVTTLSGMGHQTLRTKEDKLNYLAGLHVVLHHRQAIYIITDNQLYNKQSEHYAMVEYGIARELGTVVNHQPGHSDRNKLHIMLIDTSLGVNKYYKACGTLIPEKPTEEVIAVPAEAVPVKRTRKVKSDEY